VIGVLLNLLVVAFFVWIIARRFNKNATTAKRSNNYELRRFFQYLVLYGLLIIVAVGLSGLLGELLDGSSYVEGSRTALARSLAFTVVGLPIFVGVALWTRRRFQASADEGDSPEWGLYLTAAAITSLIVAMTALMELLEWAFGTSSYEGDALARLLVWGAAWAIHYWLSVKVTSFDRGRAHNIIGSAIGLFVSVGGLVTVFGAAIEELVFTTSSFMTRNNDLTDGLGALIAGAIVWFLYWIRRVLRSERDLLWLAYVLLLGVAGGLVMWVIAASTALYRTAVWFIGEPNTDIASGHFANLPTLIGTAVVGLLVWWYHRAVLASGPQVGRTEVSRIYEYLIAGIGLVAATIGLALVIIALFDALTGSAALAGVSAINALLAAITLLVVGLPFWWIYWSRAQRAASADPEVEVPSVTRRTYLFLLFGISGITAIVALLVAVYAFFNDAVEGQLSLQTVRDMRFAISILIATGLVAAYHIAVYNRDRSLGIHEVVRGPRRILLVGAVDDAVRKAVATRTGAAVEVWQRTDGYGVFASDSLLATLEGITSEEVMVLARDGGVEVIPIRRR
jgi:hypothetical protein